MPEHEPVIDGFTILNQRGEDLSGINTAMEGFAVRCPAPGQEVTLRALVTLPHLSRGDYAITPAVATGTLDKHCVEDRIENAVVFRVVAGQHVVGQLRLPTEFALEESLQSSGAPAGLIGFK